MKKKLLLMLLAFSVFFGGLTGTALAAGLDNFKSVKTYNQGQFVDVSSSAWYAVNVKEAYEYDLINGKDSKHFDPNGNLTVAEAIKLAACLNSIYYNGSVNISTAGAAVWYQPYVDYAKAQGIIAKDFDNYNRAVTRLEFGSIFAKAMPAEALSKINTIDDNAIPDLPMSANGAEGIYTLYRAGILTGNDAKGTFTPNSNIARSEAAAITTRMADTSLRKSITLTNSSSNNSYVFKVDKDSVVVNAGDTVAITVTATHPESDRVVYDFIDDAVKYVDGGWSEWNGDNITLSVKGLAEGTAKLAITQYDVAGNQIGNAIYVTVKVIPVSSGNSYVFKVDKTAVTVNAGETVAVTVTSTNPKCKSLSYDFEGLGINFVECSWGEFDGTSMPLYIKGYTAGTTRIKIIELDENDKIINDDVYINVTVKGVSPSSGYSYYNGYYPAVDYGSLLGIPASDTFIYESMKMYFYKADDIYLSDPNDKMRQYYINALQKEGFLYYNNSKRDDGSVVWVYKNNQYGIYVYLGTLVKDGELYIVVAVDNQD